MWALNITAASVSASEARNGSDAQPSWPGGIRDHRHRRASAALGHGRAAQDQADLGERLVDQRLESGALLDGQAVERVHGPCG